MLDCRLHAGPDQTIRAACELTELGLRMRYSVAQLQTCVEPGSRHVVDAVVMQGVPRLREGHVVPTLCSVSGTGRTNDLRVLSFARHVA